MQHKLYPSRSIEEARKTPGKFSGQRGIFSDMHFKGGVFIFVLSLLSLSTNSYAYARTLARDASALRAAATRYPSLQTVWKNLDSDPCTDSWQGVKCSAASATNAPAGSKKTLLLHSPVIELNLSSIGIQGDIPQEIGSLADLQVLNLSGNNFTGTIPPELAKLSKLTDLDLSRNNLRGTIPSSLARLSRLTSLSLQRNRLAGAIPPELGGLWRLQSLLLDSNDLTGDIPPTLAHLTRIARLGLSYNNLSGPIPSSFNQLPELADLDLSHNMLNGPVPDSFWTVMEHAKGVISIEYNYLMNGNHVDVLASSPPYSLQFNCFTGSMIQFQQQRKEDECSSYRRSLLFLQNSSATPAPIIATAPPPSRRLGTGSKAVPVATGSAVAAVVVLALLTLAYCTCYSRLLKGDNRIGDSFLTPDIKAWTFAELQSATDNFSAAHEIGKGGSATVYKAQLDNGIVAIKRFNKMRKGCEDQLLKELKLIGTLRNRNIVELRGYCIEYGEHLLVYDYMPKGTLETLLFGEGLFSDPPAWKICVKILTGVANGIAYLHEGGPRKIIHRDIKPSNVLLDEELNAHVGDCGLVSGIQVCCVPVAAGGKQQQRQGSSLGYLAQEYAMTGKLTEKSDVYSFGVLMLVVMGHRKAMDPESADGFSTIMAKVGWALEHENAMALLDSELANSPDMDKEEARRMIAIALLCVQPAWQDRPAMCHVVQMLAGTAPVPPPNPTAMVPLGLIGASSNAASLVAEMDSDFARELDAAHAGHFLNRVLSVKVPSFKWQKNY